MKKVSRKKLSTSKKRKTKSKSKAKSRSSRQLFVLEKDVLSKFGYCDIKDKTRQERQKALSKALKHIKPLSLYRRVVALSTLNKNTNPDLAKRFKDDSKWIKTTKEYANRPTAKMSTAKRSTSKD